MQYVKGPVGGFSFTGHVLVLICGLFLYFRAGPLQRWQYVSR